MASPSLKLLKCRSQDLSVLEQGSCYVSIDIVGFLARAKDLWPAVTKQVSSLKSL